MPLTVKQLIKRLGKMDQNALVAWRDHDNSQNEVNAFLNYVGECDDSLLKTQEDILKITGKKNIVLISN